MSKISKCKRRKLQQSKAALRELFKSAQELAEKLDESQERANQDAVEKAAAQMGWRTPRRSR